MVDAIEPYLGAAERQPLALRVFWQILVFTYPFWLFEYRRVQSWKYAAGIALGMRPRNLLAGVQLAWPLKGQLALIYLLVSLCGLAAPLKLFSALQPRLYALAKALR